MTSVVKSVPWRLTRKILSKNFPTLHPRGEDHLAHVPHVQEVRARPQHANGELYATPNPWLFGWSVGSCWFYQACWSTMVLDSFSLRAIPSLLNLFAHRLQTKKESKNIIYYYYINIKIIQSLISSNIQSVVFELFFYSPAAMVHLPHELQKANAAPEERLRQEFIVTKVHLDTDIPETCWKCRMTGFRV